eukprot:gene1673-33067_t
MQDRRAEAGKKPAFASNVHSGQRKEASFCFQLLFWAAQLKYGVGSRTCTIFKLRCPEWKLEAEAGFFLARPFDLDERFDQDARVLKGKERWEIQDEKKEGEVVTNRETAGAGNISAGAGNIPSSEF